MAEQDRDLEQTRRQRFIDEVLSAQQDEATMRVPELPKNEASEQRLEDATMRFPLPGGWPEVPTQQLPEEELPEEAFSEEDDFADFLADDLPELDQEDVVDAFFRREQARRPEPEPDWDEEEHGGVLMPALKTAIYLISVLLGAVLLAVLVWFAADDVFSLTDGDRPVTFTVEESDTVQTVTEKLKDAGLIRYKPLFRFYCTLTGAAKKIDPGVYELNDYYDYMALVNGMIATSGARKTVTVTIPEGYEARQILQLLAEQGTADLEALQDAAARHDFGYDFLAALPYGSETRLEGYLFPDTYEFYIDDDPERVLNKFLRNFDAKLTDDLLAQLDTLNQRLTARGLDKPLTLRDVITVASMIEKEAAVSGERTSIASVIYNRLCNPNFPYLQIDATVQYALGERKAQLSYEDLEIDSPYNTYLYAGLPAGPIACPGLNCIKAALYPADTDFYYYALDTDGSHHFSRTRLEHEQFLAEQEGQP